MTPEKNPNIWAGCFALMGGLVSEYRSGPNWKWVVGGAFALVGMLLSIIGVLLLLGIASFQTTLTEVKLSLGSLSMRVGTLEVGQGRIEQSQTDTKDRLDKWNLKNPPEQK
jgi:hypothetical protein